MKQKM